MAVEDQLRLNPFSPSYIKMSVMLRLCDCDDMKTF